MRLCSRQLVRHWAPVWIGVVFGLPAHPGDVRVISNAPGRIDVIIVAHQDDWQLFMGDAIMERLRSGDRGVFIYLTAGDDGRDSTYWRTRERAALASTEVAAGVPTTNLEDCSVISIRAHAIRKCVVGTTESYFFRLPDGKRNGKGFERSRYQSLRNLRANRISAISALDGSASYSGWNELMSTVGALVDADSTEVMVHTTDPSIASNPHDHFDHRMAGLLVSDLRKKKSVGAMYYVGYALGTRAPNRSADETRAKTELFLAYDRVMTAADRKWSAYQEHRAFYSACLQRTYVRSPRPVIR